jgi:hypothetical protein
VRLLLVLLFTVSVAVAAPAGKVFVGFTAVNAWETGFTGRITITNQTSWTIYDWRLEFDLGHPIKKIWNGRVASENEKGKGKRIVLRASAASWEDGDLSPGEKATIEFTAEGAPPKLPARGKLNGTPIVFNKASVAPPPLAPRKANRWPAQVFAPYVDTTLWPPFDFAAATQKHGIKFYTLAFIVAKGPTDPSASWGGYHLVSKRWLLPEINAIRAAGGEVLVSFGGAAGTGLAAACKTPAQLQAAYQAVIDTYGLTHIDFDVEGHWLAEAKSIERRSRAIAGLQQQARRAKRTLKVWHTLPVLPSGLTREGLGVLRSALRHHVDIAGVNIMAMNYGKAQAPKPTTHMGVYTIQAATSLHAQLKMLHREAGVRKTDAQLWAMVGLTPMLGHNDVKPETFTLANAREVLAFARRKKIGMLSCWSANRDRPPAKPSANWASPKHTGIAQEEFGFSEIFRAYEGN